MLTHTNLHCEAVASLGGNIFKGHKVFLLQMDIRYILREVSCDTLYSVSKLRDKQTLVTALDTRYKIRQQKVK